MRHSPLIQEALIQEALTRETPAPETLAAGTPIPAALLPGAVAQGAVTPRAVVPGAVAAEPHAPGPPATAGRHPAGEGARLGRGAIPLVAVAHGSRDPRAAATVEALLDRVRRRRPGLEVRSAYLDHGPPTLGQALHGLREAVVLPLLLTEAYHSRVDLPAALAEARARDARLRVRYGTTLGPHPLLLDALDRRLTEAGVATGDPGTAVVLVSAGSSDARANAVVAALARDWDRRSGWWAVTPAYASAAGPTPAEAVAALRAAGAPRVAVAPYLLAPGFFADKVRRGAGADVVSDVLGPAPELVEVLLERYELALRAEPAAVPA